MSLEDIRARTEALTSHKEVEFKEALQTVGRSVQDVPPMLAALDAVHDLHRPDDDTGKCAECTFATFSRSSVSWPCPTIQAITKALA